MNQDLVSSNAAHRARSGAVRAPGLHLQFAQTVRPLVELPQTGVPLFVGFGSARRGFARRLPTAIHVSNWEQFQACVETEGPFLGPAVQGFFANGGRRCAVLSVAAADGAAGLQRVFDERGAAENVADVDLICIPDAVAPQAAPALSLHALQTAVLAHCEATAERFAVLDAMPAAAGWQVDDLLAQANWNRSSCGALYFPWLHVNAANAPAAVPPCGHVAGVYARTDARVGVHKAPANEPVEAALAVAWLLTDAQHGVLNDAGVNCIRNTQGRGMRVCGARTLSAHGDRLYVPVSRVFLALARWAKANMDDIVFEPHTPELWQRVQRRVSAYCVDLLDAGALAGNTASGGFFVKCDAELNPPAGRDDGRLVAEVGLALSVPAEFVVVRIVHDASGVVLTEP